MKILYNMHGVYNLYNVRNKELDGYEVYNSTGGRWFAKKEQVIMVVDYDTTLEQIKHQYPEVFL